MLVQSMSRMMESIGPMSINGVQPDRPMESEGLAKDVYDQIRRQFYVAGSFVLHGEVPELLAASWTVVRETLMVGHADRGQKEIIAWAVAQGNQCSFCIDVHGAAKAAAGANDRTIEQWAKSSTSAEGAAEATGPADLDQYRAEYLGTLTAFHYLNRMVSVFLEDKMVPVPGPLNGMTRSMAKIMMGGMIDKAASLTAGDSLRFLPKHDPTTAWRPGWAADSPTVSDALAGWSAAIEAEANERFSPMLLTMLGERIAHWQGGVRLTEFSSQGNETDPLARLAMLAVEAPYQVSKADVSAAVAATSSSDTLAMVSWAAQRAARQCAGWANTDTGNSTDSNPGSKQG